MSRPGPARAGLLCALLVLVLAPAGTAASAPVPPYHPDRLTHLRDARQVVVVTSRGWDATWATLRAYRKDSQGSWHLRLGPWRGRVGWNGMVPAANRRQGTGTTPAGTFGLGPAFGSRPDPGTGLARYRQYDKNDYWVYDPRDPATYNILEPRHSRPAAWRRSWAERLADWGDSQYTYAAVIRFNLPGAVHWSSRQRQYVAGDPADTRRGGGIFLHVTGSGPTAGCVSIGQVRMRRLLRWLSTDLSPRIVIGPRSAITRM